MSKLLSYRSAINSTMLAVSDRKGGAAVQGALMAENDASIALIEEHINTVAKFRECHECECNCLIGIGTDTDSGYRCEFGQCILDAERDDDPDPAETDIPF